MADITDVLKGTGGLGLSVLGLFGGQPEVAVAGASLAGSVLSNKTTTNIQSAAAAAQRGLNAYAAAANSLQQERRTGFAIPSWLLFLGGGLLLFALLRRKRR